MACAPLPGDNDPDDEQEGEGPAQGGWVGKGGGVGSQWMAGWTIRWMAGWIIRWRLRKHTYTVMREALPHILVAVHN